uniref:SAM domain-containing protein n=1 Tax=Schistosoma japonicum TaxID=6182 RepID=C1LEX7_SCHJA|nr:SAM domain-containing protein [Schistosoma japonicum]
MSFSEICKNAWIPEALLWDVGQVACWIEDIGYPQYKECFTGNQIDGRSLIKIHSSTLPDIGVTKFEDIKNIVCKVRELLNLDENKFSRHLHLPPRSIVGMFLEARSYTGSCLSKLTFPRFVYKTQNAIWKPTLTNMGIIFNYKH